MENKTECVTEIEEEIRSYCDLYLIEAPKKNYQCIDIENPLSIVLEGVIRTEIYHLSSTTSQEISPRRS
ncbi:MAG TPA: hypothetical protein VN239_05060 [Nitrososphaera sp.]|nr:hypothetical protein [Nitrososphaera sp.]